MQHPTSETMANISSFSLYLLSTLLFLAIPNNAAENILRAAHPKETYCMEDRLELAIQSVMRAVDIGFARSVREMTEIKREVASLYEEMTTLKEGMRSLEEKLNTSSSCVEGHTHSTPGDLDPATSDLQPASEASLAAEKRFKAEIGQAVDTFTSSVTRAAIAGQKVDNSTVCPTDYDPKPSAIPPSSNCYALLKQGHNTTGLYYVTISRKQVQVYCDMTTDGGGWTVIQRRDDIEPHVDFERDWADYKRGFGDLEGEFWLGLDTIHGLTSDPSTPMMLRVDLEDWEGEERVSLYSTFVVQDEEKKYELTVGGYEKGPGAAGGEGPGDSLDWHNGMAFTTRDRDNDGWDEENCAEEFKGGWWHNSCHRSQLTGLYHKGALSSYGQGVNWYHWKGYYYSLRRAAMMIRPW